MIHLLGCSHMMALLDAACEGGWGPQLHKLENDRAPAFVEWTTRDEALPDRLKVASIYIGHFAPHWGPLLAHRDSPDVIRIAPGFQSLLQAVPEGDDDRLFVSVQGEEYHHLALSAAQSPYDFELPSRPDLPLRPGRPVIPLPVIEQQLAQRMAHAVAVLAAIRATRRRLQVTVVVCPPPADSDLVRERYAREGRPALLTDDVDTGLRLKLYTLYAQALAEAARRSAMSVLLPPPQALQADGALHPELVRDVVHGNRAYGEMMLQQLRHVLHQAAPQPA